MLFSCLAAGIQQRFVDVSHQAVQSPYFPVSLGLRSQALKLKFVSPEMEGRFLYPDRSMDQTIRIFEERFLSALPEPVLARSHVGDSTSLLYAPFYVEDRVYDAVLNRPVSQRLPEKFDAASFKGGRPARQLRFLPALCPNCGWDLDGSKASLVLGCRNCGTLWQAVSRGYGKLKFGHLPLAGEHVTYFPFWRLGADVQGLALKSYADLAAASNLPRVPRRKWRDIPFRFWTPAFKVRPRKFISLATQFTLSQPGETEVPEIPDAPLYPATLPVTEAAESLKIVLAGFLKPRSKLARELPDIQIKAQNFALIYIPFVEKHPDFVQPAFRQAINKNMLVLGARNL